MGERQQLEIINTITAHNDEEEEKRNKQDHKLSEKKSREEQTFDRRGGTSKFCYSLLSSSRSLGEAQCDRLCRRAWRSRLQT